MEKSSIEELGQLAQALVEEQREEERRLAAVLEKQSLRVRKAEGLTWSPVSVEQQAFTFGGRVKLSLRKGQNGGLDDAFRSGSPVHFYQANEAGQPADAGAVRRGIVRKGRGSELEVILDGEPLESSALHERWTLDERADDRTFRLMAEALSHWINTEDEAERILRDRVMATSEWTPPSAAVGTVEHTSLNEGQRTWIAQAEQTEHLAILHGPPGTGKTTTVLAFVERAVARGERLLLTAPSNAAVDLLVQGCAARGVNPVRIGHPMRLNEAVFTFGLDAQVERDPEYKQVKELRKRAEKSWKEAHRFHRSFGPEERAQRTAARREARSLDSDAKDVEAYIADRILRTSQVVCATLAGSADSHLDGVAFDWVIVDEASQAMQPAAWIAFKRAPRIVLAGDPHQLPPVVKSDEARARGLGVSILERAMSEVDAAGIHMLTEQYRMDSAIMELASNAFYGGQLESGITDRASFSVAPLMFIDTSGCGYDEVREEAGGSTHNPEEASFAVERVRELLVEHSSFSCGVIAPYKAQVDALSQCLSTGLDAGQLERVDCSTVDAFQGQERDIIVISLTRCNAEGNIGFLKEYRRMNVAMTRAKYRLVVIGDGATVAQDAFYAALFEAAEKSGSYHSAWEWMGA